MGNGLDTCQPVIQATTNLPRKNTTASVEEVVAERVCANQRGGSLQRSNSATSMISASSASSWASSASSGCGCNTLPNRNHRFHWVPQKGWDTHARGMGISARNNLPWSGKKNLPKAPDDSWLLPASDEMSMTIAMLEAPLRKKGWKIVTSQPHIIERLGNKASFRDYAASIGMLPFLPVHFDDPARARYPCVLKPAVGEFGKDMVFARCKEDVVEATKDSWGMRWLLQEMIPGRFEYAVSLLVRLGTIVDAIGTSYEYDREIYIWPNVNEVGRCLWPVPEAHLQTMSGFLHDYHGICNFNYKIREDGRMAMFEVNTRIGSDLACDVPRWRAREFFKRLDKLFS